MIESDSELKEWWNRLTIYDRDELLEKIEEKAAAPRTQNMVMRVRQQIKLGFSPNQYDLREIKKWAR